MESVETTNLNTLIETIADLRAQNAALKKRIEFLEMVLQQRVELTQKSYQERRAKFNQMQELVLTLFMQNPGQSFSYTEAQEEWLRMYPNLKTSAINVPRRIRELVQAKRLWSNIGDDGLARFWLQLEEKQPEG